MTSELPYGLLADLVLFLHVATAAFVVGYPLLIRPTPLFYTAPAWVFIATYGIFGALVALMWWRRPLPSRAWSLLAAVGLAASLAGCTSPPGAAEVADTRQRPATDPARMCEMHELMMAGSSPEEQQTMLEQYLKSIHGRVDEAMVARHRQAMAGCPAALPASR